jgi:hypothetical protein
MTIEQILYKTPIVKDTTLLNSKDFLQILLLKHSGLSRLNVDAEKVEEDLKILIDLESVMPFISSDENLMFLRFVIGIKYVDLGASLDNKNYLSKGIEILGLINEDSLGNDIKPTYYLKSSRCILLLFNSELEKSSFEYSYDGIEPLLKAKYYLFKLYNLLVEGKIVFDAKTESKFISDLVTILVLLSRWNEPFFILSRRKIVSKYNPEFISYLKAHTLNEIAHFTCCTIYPVMTYEMKKFIGHAKLSNETDEVWNTQLQRLEQEVDRIIEKNPFKIEEFGNQEKELIKQIDEHSDYRKWVLENHFSLCEHAMYCFCSLSKSDDLTIRSNHEHTQIEWVDKFEVLLDRLKGEYNLARYFLYLAEDDSRLHYNRNDEVGVFSNESHLLNTSSSDYLIQSFKSAYSILDKIARAVYLALDIDQKDIYFHKCWQRVKNSKGENTNRYLFALYSIACDLSETSKYSAFKEYKEWRNLIEHEFFFLSNGTQVVSNNNDRMSKSINIAEFREKSYYMLQLCRTAVFSFTFFIRHESKKRESKGAFDKE